MARITLPLEPFNSLLELSIGHETDATNLPDQEDFDAELDLAEPEVADEIKLDVGDAPDFAKTFTTTDSESVDPVRLYLRDVETERLLTAAEEVSYSRLAQAGNEAARQKMIVCNLRLVIK
ncbi:MAG TPA: sigma-70 factor domain-containing protein, partial [Halothiobacillus sp.]